jgi:hypothetical protein
MSKNKTKITGYAYRVHESRMLGASALGVGVLPIIIAGLPLAAHAYTASGSRA